MSAEHHGPEAALDRRSALPSIPGIPWWGAIVLAVTATAIGFAYDAGTGDKELSAFFTFCYVAGCVLAVLAVRRSGIFTAVIQPPLILFVAVPGAYFMFHSDKIAGIKDLLINCGYPLIERFPTMFFTAAAVLVLGLVRWFVLPQFLTYEDDDEDEAVAEAKPRRTRRQADDEDVAPAGLAGLAATLSAKLTKLTTGQTPRSSRTRATPSRRSAAEAPRRSAADPQRAPRPARARAHAGDTELIDPVPGQMRRPRPARPRPADTDPYAVPDEPRRRPRPANDPREPRRTPPQERYDYREPRERDRYERPSQRPAASEPRRRRYADDPYEPVDRYQSPARPSRSAPPSGAHHPVSRVRYRGADDDAAAPEPRERRPRQPQSWD
ncbi:DUF6542 domain-containing protein [Mycolicibacterium aubagnense]|uniref:DUF6542 domain-containing protein n=1 Tax=Mycolicibacterium aubagnense TaxID=319707 RepID=UPI0010FE8CF2|nr:DUF6542 domain-containing protein [Mycolicibacterium aubagnense]TLH67868.1 hypothetical protein C1S80_04815 [Mycolicibacterium aubagnense]WGI31988.1 hypothetical protein QDT91_22725 [Mycolicibacterium aubagnense]